MDGVSYYRCIGNFVSDSVLDWVNAHAKFRQGVMPFPGSYLDQPAKVIELFAALENHFQKQAREAERREQNKRAMMGARGGGRVGRR